MTGDVTDAARDEGVVVGGHSAECCLESQRRALSSEPDEDGGMVLQSAFHGRGELGVTGERGGKAEWW